MAKEKGKKRPRKSLLEGSNVKRKKLKLKQIAEEEVENESSDDAGRPEVPEIPIELIDEDVKDEEMLPENAGPADVFVDDGVNITDEYTSFLDRELDDETVAEFQHKYKCQGFVSWENLHKINYMKRTANADANTQNEANFLSTLKVQSAKVTTSKEMSEHFGIQTLLASNWVKLNNKNESDSASEKEVFTPLQKELFTIMRHYVSIYYPCLDVIENAQEIQQIVCLHALNHVLQARSQVVKNNMAMAKLTREEKELAEYRDQGLVRPKVLILTPFREKAYKMVNTFFSLLKRDTTYGMMHTKRFNKEFKPEYSAEIEQEQVKNKPQDYQELFAGNTAELFRVGIEFRPQACRLYSPFYSADILVASPLGLRTIIAEKGEENYEYDFLSSVEILVMDHADVFMMQNWEHVIHITKHLHLQPKKSHDVDFSRVRYSSLEGQAKHFCQVIVLSSISTPQLSSLAVRHCFNHKGLAMIENVTGKGTICTVTKSVPQIFHKLNVTAETFSDVQNLRFKFFTEQILRQIKEKKMERVLIYIPQYFDFVRLRNHMRREKKSASCPAFGQICEYTEASKVAKTRRKFLTSKFPVLLYTERYHFYNRPFIRGFRHLIFYDLPTYPHFYSELCNMVNTSRQDDSPASVSAIAVYSKYDAAKLLPVLGAKRGEELMKSPKHIHMFFTGSEI